MVGLPCYIYIENIVRPSIWQLCGSSGTRGLNKRERDSGGWLACEASEEKERDGVNGMERSFGEEVGSC